MAKVITQETFDSAVKENIEEFEMNPEEALEDAIKQFEAQGVNLSNIVKDLSMYTDGAGSGDSKHPVIEAIEKLKNVEVSDRNKIDGLLSTIKAQCDIDIAHRCLAGSNGAYPVLLELLEKSEADPELQKNCIDTLTSLCDGQPDLLDDKGVKLFCGKLKEDTQDTAYIAALLKLVRITCIMHEANRQNYVTNDIIHILVVTLEKHKSDALVVKECCYALRALTLDDDVRAAFGKAHEHAKLIVTEEEALKKILNICVDYSKDPSVLGELFATLSRLAVRNEFCQEIMDLGGLAMVLKAFEDSIDNQLTTKQMLDLLKAIAGNDKVKEAIVNEGGVELILAAITKHQRQALVCETGCASLAALALRNPDHCNRIMTSGGDEVIVKCMQLHEKSGNVQKQSCMAIRNIVARTKEHCQAFLQLETESLIRKAIQNHPNCTDEGKAALRDLGCDIELKTPWAGTGKDLQR